MQKFARTLSAWLGLVIGASLHAAEIEDNSFLVEEAYNQEPGVVQFIQTYQKDKNKDSFYSLTVEIPAPNETHQISFMLPYTNLQGPPATQGIGDVGLNYRYQLFNNEAVSVAPRISILLPSGDDDKGLGTGVTGWQTNWAVSVKASPCLALHMNVGATYLPGMNVSTGKKDLYGSNSALSLVWLVHDNFNLLVEYVNNAMEGDNSIDSSAIINPGFRYAVNFQQSQLVVGASRPTPVLYSKDGEASYLLYLSYEPKLW